MVFGGGGEGGYCGGEVFVEVVVDDVGVIGVDCVGFFVCCGCDFDLVDGV